MSDPQGQATRRGDVLEGRHSYGSVTDTISAYVLQRRVGWSGLAVAIVSFGLVAVMLTAITVLLLWGVGVWGINVPVAWGFAITNFVWWIGIGHAGTLISAILLLLRQPWRTSINRFAEAMTLFAVACAGMFPLLHLGRPWLFYWLIPYPNTMGVWPQFRSPLIWDVFAVGTYATVSLIFWYVGLIPDLASMRDKAKRRFPQIAYGFLALGWRGSARHWKRYQTAYLLLAGLATPLVVSVHTVVSYDFAVSLLPGWHNTLFPPYFVAGAVFSGFSMVLTIAIPLRKAFRLNDFITTRHLDMMAKVMLATGLIVAYGYLMETFTGFYSANQYEAYVVTNRAFGPYAPAFWLQILCNVAVPQLLWFRWFRTKPLPLFIVAIFINIGMWVERYVIVITSLHRDFMPSSWGMFHGTFWDWSLLLGSVGLFAALLFLFVRFLPMISIYEMRELVHEQSDQHDDQPGESNQGEASSSK